MSDVRDIAIIDDDTLQVLILQEMCVHADLRFDVLFHHFDSVEAFCAAQDPSRFWAVMLDYRLPPHRNYADSLALIEDTRFDGPVLLMSAARSQKPAIETRLDLIGPIEKSEFQHPNVVRRHLQQLTPQN